jgi:YHS domain-containing protein/Spy/CpxP family protein refolding chaperone
MKYGIAILYAVAILFSSAMIFAAEQKMGMPGMMHDGNMPMGMHGMMHDGNMPMMKGMDANMCPKGMMLGKCCQMTMAEKMKCCGMSEAMVDKCQMMMNTRIWPSDPEALIAMKDRLALTAEQTDKLDAIAKKAREDAAAVLTAEQQSKIKATEAEPATMMELHQTMMQKMKEKGMMGPGSTMAEKSSTMAVEQTTCPITGQPINKKYSTVYKGKTVYFCCPMCKPIFEKNPEKYIDKLPQFKQ